MQGHTEKMAEKLGNLHWLKWFLHWLCRKKHAFKFEAEQIAWAIRCETAWQCPDPRVRYCPIELKLFKGFMFKCILGILEAKRRKIQEKKPASKQHVKKPCQARWNVISRFHGRFHQNQERSLLACMLPLRNFQVQTFRLSNHAQTGNAHSCERRLKRYWLWSEFFIEVKSTSFWASSWRLQLRSIRFEYKSKISNRSCEQSIESMFLFFTWPSRVKP